MTHLIHATVIDSAKAECDVFVAKAGQAEDWRLSKYDGASEGPGRAAAKANTPEVSFL